MSSRRIWAWRSGTKRSQFVENRVRPAAAGLERHNSSFERGRKWDQFSGVVRGRRQRRQNRRFVFCDQATEGAAYKDAGRAFLGRGEGLNPRRADVDRQTCFGLGEAEEHQDLVAPINPLIRAACVSAAALPAGSRLPQSTFRLETSPSDMAGSAASMMIARQAHP